MMSNVVKRYFFLGTYLRMIFLEKEKSSSVAACLKPKTRDSYFGQGCVRSQFADRRGSLKMVFTKASIELADFQINNGINLLLADLFAFK